MVTDTQCDYCRHRRHVGSCQYSVRGQFSTGSSLCGCHVDVDGNPDAKYLERELARRRAAGDKPTPEEWAAAADAIARQKAAVAEQNRRDLDEFAPPLTEPLPSSEVREW